MATTGDAATDLGLSMSVSINNYLETICIQLETKFPDVKADVLAGFTIDPKDRRVSPPCVFVSLMEADPVLDDTGLLKAKAKIGLFVIDEHSLRDGRHSNATELANNILLFCHMNTLSVPNAQPCQLKAFKNMFHRDMESNGLGQYGIIFEQEIFLESEETFELTVKQVSTANGDDEEALWSPENE